MGRQRAGLLLELSGGHDPVGEANAEGLVGFDLAAGEDHVLGASRPHEPGQALGPAGAGDDAEQDLGLAEGGGLGRHPQVAGQGQLASAPEGVAGHGRDRRPGNAGNGVERLPEVPADARRLLPPPELGDVGARREDAIASSDDDGAGRVGRQLPSGLGDLTEQRHRQRIRRRPVERDDRDPVVTALQRQELGHDNGR